MDNKEALLANLYQQYLQQTIALHEQVAVLQVENEALKEQIESCPKDDCPTKAEDPEAP